MKRVRTKEDKKRWRTAQLEKAKRLYRLLLHVVGGPNLVCAICRCTEEDRPMQLDHVHGKNWRSKDMRLDARVKRYRDELKAGVKFRVLCIDCNSKDGRARQMEGRVSAIDAEAEWYESTRPERRKGLLEFKDDGVLFHEGSELF